MKKILSNRMFLVIVTAIIFSGISAFATTQIVASNIKYKNTTVEEAIDDLYSKAKPEYIGNTTVTPTTSEQVLSTNNKILKSNITINPIPTNYKALSTLTNELTSSDLLSGKQGYKADGTVVNGNIPTYSGSTNITPTTESQTLLTGGKYLADNIVIGASSTDINVTGIGQTYKNVYHSDRRTTSDAVILSNLPKGFYTCTSSFSMSVVDTKKSNYIEETSDRISITGCDTYNELSSYVQEQSSVSAINSSTSAAAKVMSNLKIFTCNTNSTKSITVTSSGYSAANTAPVLIYITCTKLTNQ